MKSKNLVGFFCLSLVLATAPAAAQIITVDITEGDLIDVDPETATVADLPGPDGHISFSEAMIASNNTPGRQTIGFAIPTSEWTYLPAFYPGRAVVHGLSGAANANSPVTINGTTQTIFTGNTNPDGHEVVILWGGGLYFPANNCKISGLDQTSVWIEGSHAMVTNNSRMGITLYGGFGGSGATITGNTGGGYVQIDQSSFNVVTGNTLDRVRVLGAMAVANPAMFNQIGGKRMSDRNFIIGNGTKNSQGIPGGYAVQIFESIGTVVQNNWIGTTPDGLSQGHPYTTIGIWLDSENHFTIIQDNRIAGVLALATPQIGPSYLIGNGIQLSGTGNGVSITGNKIGLDANGSPTLGSVTGISLLNYYLGPFQDVNIGDPTLRSGNEIAGNWETGIKIGNSYSGVTVSRNSLHDNDGLGINLIDANFQTGVSPNDPLDTDLGANELQNFPVVRTARLLAPTSTRGATRVFVAGTINSNPSSRILIEFFGSPFCNASGYGEGSLFLGSATVTTDARGNAFFKSSLSTNAPIAEGWVVTGTATNLKTGSTSEFSACVDVTVSGL